jgi:predicted nucleotidyltransferase
MSLFEELIEDLEQDKKIVKSFRSKDSLPETIFDKKNQTYVLKDEIREKMLEVSNDFLNFIEINFFVYDIILTGSLANYNWSSYSDVDLHILIDFQEFGVDNKIYTQIVKEFFDDKKTLWNNNTDAKIKGFDVELYLQDINEKHTSSGVYSVMNDEWIKKPEYESINIPDGNIKRKTKPFKEKINDLVQNGNKNPEKTGH